jgi:hypothetical protein
VKCRVESGRERRIVSGRGGIAASTSGSRAWVTGCVSETGLSAGEEEGESEGGAAEVGILTRDIFPDGEISTNSVLVGRDRDDDGIVSVERGNSSAWRSAAIS